MKTLLKRVERRRAEEVCAVDEVEEAEAGAVVDLQGDLEEVVDSAGVEVAHLEEAVASAVLLEGVAGNLLACLVNNNNTTVNQKYNLVQTRVLLSLYI